MRQTAATIAKQLRSSIGKDYELICSRPAGAVSQDEYLQAVSESQQAQSMARYLTQHMRGIDPKSFAAACGIRG
jgi:hypothetical protein